MKNFILGLLASFTVISCAQADVEINEDVKIFDVRTTSEWQTGHLESATHLSMELLPTNIELLVPDKSQQVVLYCRSGNRAGQMMSVMQKLGYTNVINVGSVRDASKLLKDNVIVGK
ncbi:rhodanese-like domain-containing protein [Marinicellulosiphila megalodicopiae]|uniref:rhodanese-like domain-containing protein n=1 Tax=Marinicellulosiphila megalodicopiae TaxID=2724896 RepID=UPI003BAEFA48